MNNIQIKGTERSPEINFNFLENNFAMRGGSYPENITEFFGKIMKQFYDCVSDLTDAGLTFTFELIYFNSSTAKVLVGIFDRLDEIGKDLEHAEFNLVTKEE